ncbi:MAG TPA: transglycosylase family protein [Yinghuangia sp.]|nr:transglycosylase family protein [Yinghuangia sp.]
MLSATRNLLSNRKSIAVAAGVTGAAIALPMLGATSASAASVSTWDRVAQCESTNNWSINSGNGFYGGLQFTNSTWQEFGGTQYAPRADLATKDQQIAIAEKVLAVQGPGAWPVCSVKAGLTKNSGTPSIDTGSAAKPVAAASSASSSAASSSAGSDNASASGAQATQSSKPAAAQTTAATYSVVAGDTLSKIANTHDVAGGWQKLYQDNRSVIGGNPNMIHQGQKLTLNGKASASASNSASSAATTTATASDKAASSQETSSSGYVRPVSGAPHGSYGNSGSLWSNGHTGEDFSAASGTPVKAVTSGTIVKAGWGGAYGNEIVIKHADGKYTQYGHLSSLSVSVGQKVATGQQVGLAGSTGNSTGPHLHFEVRTTPSYGSDVNPLAYLRAHGVNI